MCFNFEGGEFQIPDLAEAGEPFPDHYSTHGLIGKLEGK
jgi:hypothetical protein